MKKPTQLPIRSIPSEEQFLAFAQSVIEVERSHHQRVDRQPAVDTGAANERQAELGQSSVRIASLAELRLTSAREPSGSGQGDDDPRHRPRHQGFEFREP